MKSLKVSSQGYIEVVAMDNNKNITKVDNSNSNIDLTIQDDFEYARATVYNLSEKSSEMIEVMFDLFRESEHPRAGEVLSNMIKQNAELPSQLLDIQTQKKKLNDIGDNKEEVKSITNNNVFVGTTTDLQRLLIESTQDIIIEEK